MEHIDLNGKCNVEKSTNNNNEVKHVYKIPDNYSTLQSMSEIKKCVEKISSLQKVLKDSSSNSKSSFDQVDRAINLQSKNISTTIIKKEIVNVEPKTDGEYFLEILKAEQKRLNEKAGEIEEDIKILTDEGKIDEDVLGLLRSTSGKARLLASQKMKQFDGLCHKNLNQIPGDKFKTTNEDLQGFWDMVKLQVNHVDSLFEEIDKLKSNNWILEISENSNNINIKSVTKKPASNVIVKKSVQKPTQNANGTAEKQEARRRELLELKRKAKSAIQNKETNDPNKLEFFF